MILSIIKGRFLPVHPMDTCYCVIQLDGPDTDKDAYCRVRSLMGQVAPKYRDLAAAAGHPHFSCHFDSDVLESLSARITIQVFSGEKLLGTCRFNMMSLICGLPAKQLWLELDTELIQTFFRPNNEKSVQHPSGTSCRSAKEWFALEQPEKVLSMHWVSEYKPNIIICTMKPWIIKRYSNRSNIDNFHGSLLVIGTKSFKKIVYKHCLCL